MEGLWFSVLNSGLYLYALSGFFIGGSTSPGLLPSSNQSVLADAFPNYVVKHNYRTWARFARRSFEVCIGQPALIKKTASHERNEKSLIEH